MQIISITPKLIQTYNHNIKSNYRLLNQLSCDTVTFSGNSDENKPLKDPKGKHINIELEKNKILNKLQKIQNTIPKEVDEDKRCFSILHHLCTLVAKLPDNLKPSKYVEMGEDGEFYAIERDLPEGRQLLTPEEYQKVETVYKEILKLRKELKNPPKTTNNKGAGSLKPKYDYALFYNFRNAINDNNFDLRHVYYERYGALNNIDKIKELEKKFPTIEIPRRPSLVIAEKIKNTLTNDFYNTLDNLYMQDKKVAHKFVKDTLNEKLTEYSKSKKIDTDLIYKKTQRDFLKLALAEYRQLKSKNMLNSVPKNKKSSINLTDNDLTLINIDFDKFVTDVIKQIYLNQKKPNDIIYNEDNNTIRLSCIKDKDYKFEKFPEIIKSFILDAEKIQFAETDYDHFSKNDFKNRLYYYLDKELSDNKQILETISEFYNCDFHKEDIDPLISFLQTLDKIENKQISINEGLATIKANNLKPIGSNKMKEQQIRMFEEQLKQEQAKIKELNEYKTRFDNIINTLYTNGLLTQAEEFENMRPTTLNQSTMKFITGIEKIISKYNINNNIIDKEQLSNELFYFNSYFSLKDKEPNSIAIRKAEAFAKDKDDNVNEAKAGHYLSLFELVEGIAYGSLTNYQYSSLAQKLLEKSNNADSIVRELCNYEDLKNSVLKKDFNLTEILSNYDIKNELDKIVLKDIIENDYINRVSSAQTQISKFNDNKHFSYIMPEAKKAILEHYNFPNCIDVFERFEEALTHHTTRKRGGSGIKEFKNTDSSVLHKMELKIMNYPDRLFSSKNNYEFDIYDKDGLH